MKKIDVSIIIVNWNTKELLLGCIDSIVKSKPKVKYEIIVVDNSSTDGSVDEIEKLKRKKKNCNLKFRIFKNTQNLGFARANNQGIKAAKGEYILLLNSDTVVKNQAIDRLISFAKKQDDAGGVVPKLLNKDGSIQASVYRFPTLGRAVRQYWLGERNILDKYVPTTDYRLQTTVEVAVMAAFLITPRALRAVGKLNEKYFMYFEDFDYCREIRKTGLKIYYLVDSEIIHLHGASGGVNQMLIDSSKKYHGAVNYYIFTFILWSGQKLRSLLA